MLRALVAAVFLTNLASAATFAEEKKEDKKPQRLPQPLDKIDCDMSLFAKSFKLVKVVYFPSGKFATPDPRPRVVKEETLVWTLQASRDLKAAELNKLLSNPFPRIHFRRLQNDKEVNANARAAGYGLFHDGRWLGTRGPDLQKGEQIRIWTHLGKEGSAGLLRSKATQAVFKKGKSNNKRKRRSS